MKKYLLMALLLIPFIVFCQDFYINQKTEASYLNYVISPQWIDLNLNESYEFLYDCGFKDIKTINNDGKEIVYGTIKGGQYIYTRRLVFQNKVITEYSDGIEFIQPCILCLANDIKEKFKNNPDMQKIANDGVARALQNDTSLKDLFFKNHIYSLKKDGIESPLYGDITDFGFSFRHSVETDNYEVKRSCFLKLDEDNIYNFYSERKVIINDETYLVGNYNLKETNQYDLKLMVDVFLLDCKNNDIVVKKGDVITSFETLDGSTLGLSYGINNDIKIELKIDPEKWANASIPKRWYLIYHELGHDVLNLQHGNGGKMMFNFSDKGYSWKEFWEDRKYMFESYKKNKK
jgi:hypothetical protein